LYSAFKGREEELLSRDNVHPNQKGYIVMAKTIEGLGYGPLTNRDD
jgi:lysophospholipase L1-like esterase